MTVLGRFDNSIGGHRFCVWSLGFVDSGLCLHRTWRVGRGWHGIVLTSKQCCGRKQMEGGVKGLGQEGQEEEGEERRDWHDLAFSDPSPIS